MTTRQDIEAAAYELVDYANDTIAEDNAATEQLVKDFGERYRHECTEAMRLARRWWESEHSYVPDDAYFDLGPDGYIPDPEECIR